MKYLFELSKEHDSFSREEIISLLKAEKIDFKIIESNEFVLIIEINNKKINKIYDRLSYTYYVDDFLFSSKPNLKKIIKLASDKIPFFTGSIAIKYTNRSQKINSQDIVKSLAEVFTKKNKVDLENPDNEIRALITDNKIYVGQKIYNVNRSKFEKRKVQFRPFFSPISLHPKIARVLVNLSIVAKGETLLDPFCGTGGILIEAGLIGINIIGSDIQEKMVNGSKKNLEYYNIKNYNLFTTDIGSIDRYVKKVDSVVTDLPYGKSTTTKGEDMIDLYDRAFEKISKVLKKDRYAVIGLSDKKYISVAKKYLKLVKVHEFIAHRSLTRFFVVFKKEP